MRMKMFSRLWSKKSTCAFTQRATFYVVLLHCLMHCSSWRHTSSEQKLRYKKPGCVAWSWMTWAISWRFKVDHSSVGQTVARSSTGQNPKLLSTLRGSSGRCLTPRAGYAIVSYARYGHVSGMISAALVTAKAKITPIKSVNIPRLRLMTAVFGVRLAETVSKELEIQLRQHTL